MTDEELEDVFGEQFAQDMRKRIAQRREERNQLTEEQMMRICHMAINEDKIDPSEGDPMFTFNTDDGMSHTVLLMQVPDPQNGEVWEHLDEPWEGAANLPLEYLDEWYWSTFPDKKDVADLEQGQHVIAAGDINEGEGEDGQVYKNFSPVRGIVGIMEAKELAKKAEETEFSDTSEETQDDVFSQPDDEEDVVDEVIEDEEEEEDDDDGGLFGDASNENTGGGLDSLVGDDDEEEDEEEEEPVPYDQIASTVEMMSEKQDEDDDPQVYEIEEGSSEHQRLTTIVVKNVDEIDSDQEEAVAETVMDVIEAHREQDNEEEDEEEEVDNNLF